MVNREALLARITVNPKVLVGKPTIRGLRISVAQILDALAAQVSTQELLEEYPDLESEDIQAALLYAAEQASESRDAHIATLRRLATDKLGEGIWGLLKTPTGSFSHDEIIFLFARVFEVLGFDAIQEIRQQYPDCIATRDGESKYIEFEPVLSSFRPHLSKDDLDRCNYIVCWADDLAPGDLLKNTLRQNGIEVIELKEVYNKTKISRSRQKPYKYQKEDIERLTEKQLKILSAFIERKKSLLTTEELGEITGLVGRALGGATKGFTERAKSKDWLLKKTGQGWKFNDDYREMVAMVVHEFKRGR